MRPNPWALNYVLKSVHPIFSFNIPSGLHCPSESVRGLNRFTTLSESADRIVGGEEAVRNSWPWIVRLKIGAFLCGGTIIGETCQKWRSAYLNSKIITEPNCFQTIRRLSLPHIVARGLRDLMPYPLWRPFWVIIMSRMKILEKLRTLPLLWPSIRTITVLLWRMIFVWSLLMIWNSGRGYHLVHE